MNASPQQDKHDSSKADRSDWNKPLPAAIPEPTLWPAALALGITFLLWGLVSSMLISGAGAALSVVALTGWIRDLRHEKQNR
jgi:hypothetical protein